ncbi:hypothetical protein E1140_00180, partial [Fulvivirga lutimaris]|nr:hypothetical protein [Fulvivirga lutimaris]
MTKKIVDNIKFILYNLIVVLILLCFSELLIKHLLNNPAKIPKSFVTSFRNFYRENDRSTIQVVPECGKYDSNLFYTLRPGTCQFKNREFNNQFNVNEIGVRDDMQSLEFPEIITTGDSFTMGWGVDNEEAFPSQLEKQTGRVLLNSAVSSYGTVREMMILNRVKLDSVKTLIIQYHPNDYEENKKYYDNNNSLPISPEEVYQSTVNQVASNKKYYFGKYTSQILKQYIKDKVKPEDNYLDNREKECELFLNSLISSNLQFDRINVVIFELNNFNEESNFIPNLRNEIKKNRYPDYVKNFKIL